MWAERERSGKRSGAWAERKRERSVETGAGLAENHWAGAERGAGGRGAGTERGAGVAEISLSADRLFRRSRSAHAPLTLRTHALDVVLLSSSVVWEQVDFYAFMSIWRAFRSAVVDADVVHRPRLPVWCDVCGRRGRSTVRLRLGGGRLRQGRRRRRRSDLRQWRTDVWITVPTATVRLPHADRHYSRTRWTVQWSVLSSTVTILSLSVCVFVFVSLSVRLSLSVSYCA